MINRIKGYLSKLNKILRKPEMAILPSNIAFNIILAIVPLLTIVVLIASNFGISISFVTNLINNIMPRQVSAVIIDVISGKGFDRSIGIFNVVAFIIASNGTYAIINTSNTLYKIKNNDYIRARVSSIILLFIVIILFVFLLVVPIFGNNILSIMKKAKLLSQYAEEVFTLFNIIKWPITLLIIYLNIKLIYTIAPSRNIKSEETTYGAVFTTVCWILVTLIFKFYLNHFARYDILYGNLAAIIIMMVWIYFLSYIFVLGMAINATRQEEKDLFEETMRLELETLNKTKKTRKKNKEENK